MADNKTVINNSGNTGTDVVVATDEIGGINYQRVKVTHGADGTATDASTAAPLPVDDDASQTILTAIQGLLAGTLTVGGSLSVSGTMPVSQAPATSGGYSISRTLAAASTNATSVKASAGQVYGWYLHNTAAYAVFLKLYNTASAPTAGSGTPVMTIGVPAASAVNAEFLGGIAFATGIGFTITKLIADADTTVLVANDLAVNLFYK